MLPTLRRSQSVLALLAVTLSALSCGREPTGAGDGRGIRYAQGFSLLAKFPEGFEELRREAQSAPSGAGDVVAFTKVRVTLRTVTGDKVLETIENFPVGATDFPLTLSVPLPADAPASGLPLRLTLEYLNDANTVVFTGGPVGVTAVPVVQGQAPPPPAQITIPITYTGPGSNANGIRFSIAPTTANTNQPFTFVAQATDASGAVIANVPILYNSLNPLFATINAATGAGTAGPSRGVVGIEAKLLTGPSVVAQLTIVSPAASIAAVSGSGQNAPVGATLTDPVVVRVLASDGGPAAGVTVTFAAQNGGSVGSASVATDANGQASTTWRLGATVGAQTMTASVSGLTGSPVTFTATGRAVDPVRIVFGQQPPTSAAAGTSLTPAVTVQAVDASGAVTTAFNGRIILALAPGAPAGAALTGTTDVAAVNGVATFADLKINTPGSYNLVATSSGLIGATSNALAIVAGAANRLAFQNYPVIGATAGAILDPVTVVVRDAFNNPVTNFTGAVTLTANGPTAASTGSQALPPGIVRVTPNGDQANALLGTTTVNAVGGIATFSDIRLTSAGGYTLTASASGILPANSPNFTITPGPASTLVLVSGGGQSAAGGAALSNPIVVQVTDGFGNGVSGVTVNFTPVAGNGSTNPVSAVTVGGGTAQTVWTLSGSAGAKSLNVSGSGLSPNPLVVSATATSSSGTLRTWTGATSNAFNVATNWSPAGVPGSADQLVVPLGPPSPSITAPITVGSITIAAGATLDNSSSLTVTGSVLATPYIPSLREVNASIIGYTLTGGGQLTLSGGAGSQLLGTIQNQIVVSGQYTLTGNVQVAGAFQIISSGTVTVGGQTLNLLSDFYTVGSGKLVMTNAADAVIVRGNATFGGGDEHGSLTAGKLELQRNFSGSGATFSATGSHRALFTGDFESTQSISFSSPVPGRGFLNATFAGWDEKILVGTVPFIGSVDIASSATQVTGAGATARIGGNLTDSTYVLYDTLGAWRVSTTEFTAGGQINAQFITTEVVITGGTRQMAPYSCVECVAARGALRAAPIRGRSALQAGIVDAGYAQINGHVNVIGATAVLDVNSTELYINGNFVTASGGKLKMVNEYDYLEIEGSASFGGGSTAGLLTAGELEVYGDFMQGGGAADAFSPAATFYTWLGDYCDPYYESCGVGLRAPRPGRAAARDGAARQQDIRHTTQAARFDALRQPRLAARRARNDRRAAVFAARGTGASARSVARRSTTRSGATRAGAIRDVRRAGGLASVAGYSFISFANPGSSAFGTLYLQGTDYELGSDVNILGRLETGGGYGFSVFSSSPRTVTAHGADVRELYFDNVRWVLLDGFEIWSLDGVEFTNMDPAVDQFTINRTATELGGESSGYTLWYWSFGTAPTTGRYINAIDSDAIVPALQLYMYYPTPSVHGGRIATSGGAVINNWVANFVWTGLGSSDIWGDGGNWSTGFPPGSLDDVTIPSGTPFNPRVNSYGYVRNLTIANGVTIQIDGSLLAYGNVDAPDGYLVTPCSTGNLYLNANPGDNKTVRGRFCRVDIALANYSIGSGNQLITDGDFSTGGHLALNGGQLHVGGPNGTGAGSLIVINNGSITMTNSADRLFVGSGGAFWQGGSTTGKLTAGIYTQNGGSFSTSGGSPDSFAPSSNFSTQMNGANTLFFSSPNTSFFNDLTLGAGATLTLNSDFEVHGTLTRASGAGTTTIGASTTRFLNVRGLNIAGANPTNFSNVGVVFIDGQPASLFSNVKFENFPASFDGIMLLLMRSTGPLSLSVLDFSGQTLGTNGRFIRNAGAANVTITSSNPATGALNVNYDKTGAGGISWP